MVPALMEGEEKAAGSTRMDSSSATFPAPEESVKSS